MSKAVNLGTLADDISVSNGKANLSGISLTPGSAPSSPVQGDIYLDSSDYNLKIWTGGFWKDIVNASPSFSVDYLVVAGGGGGGGNLGGGGGAGGFLEILNTTLAINELYTVTVGSGGAGNTDNSVGTKGQDTIFYTSRAYGGGGGAGDATSNGDDGLNGGSGGGSRSATGTIGGVGVYVGSSYIDSARQGYDGGSAIASGSYRQASSGGGGAGGAGQTASSTPSGGNGGVSKLSTITGIKYAGGGGGGGNGNGSGLGGGTSTTADKGGGGDGGNGSGANGWDGAANTGGGGGGSGIVGGDGGNGGDGVVILRYPANLTISQTGLTISTTTVGSNKVTTITQGTGTVSWS